MPNKDNILKRIEKLLTLANNQGASDGEVKNALDKVALLMREHNLTDSDLRFSSDVETASEFVDEVMNEHTSLYHWEKYLLHRISEATLCTMLYGKSYNEGTGRFHDTVEFCGRGVDVALSHYLYRYLRKVIIERSKGIRYNREDFCSGMVYGFSKQLEAYRSTVNALVPVGLEDWVYEKYPVLRKNRRRSAPRPHVSREFIEGIQAGNEVNIHRPLSAQAISSS